MTYTWPHQDEFNRGMGRSGVTEPIKRQLAQFGGVENFKRLIGGEERFERLTRTYADGIPWWELPVGGP
jgi:hypothetical protein